MKRQRRIKRDCRGQLLLTGADDPNVRLACRRCRRTLRSPVSKRIGYGAVCAKKAGVSYQA
jgi:hypothetical protein